MPARLRQVKSDTYVPEPVGFAIPEAEMRSAAHGHFRPCALLYAGAWPGEAVCLFLLPQAADAATTDNERQQQARKRNDTPYPDAENAVK